MSEKTKVISQVGEDVSKIIDEIFQLERLEELAKGNTFVRAAYAQCIAHINYALLQQPNPENPGLRITISDVTYPLTLDGRKGAIAESFQHMAEKLDQYLNINNVASILGQLDFAADIAKSMLATKVI